MTLNTLTNHQGTIDWDDAFANMAHVDGSHALPDIWAKRAETYRASLDGALLEADIGYGDTDRQKLDFFWPDDAVQGLGVFVHGGFWMRLDKSYWSDLAEGARQNGWAVCLPSYTLTPDARIHQITQEIGRAIGLAAQKVEGPICLAGHSAGGHLVTRMMCEDSPLAPDIRERIVHCLSISGLHDLRPLMKTKMNDTLHLDEAEACLESPALHRPAHGQRLTCWVGCAERPEFIRQSKLLALMWQGLDVQVDYLAEKDHNHFTILEDLKGSQTAITQAFLGKPSLTTGGEGMNVL